MAVSYVGVSNAAGQNNGNTTPANTVAITPTLPGSAANGDRIFVIQCASNTSGTTPTNWTVVGTKDTAIASSLGAAGAGVGQRFMTVYYRDYDGVWTMPSFSLTSATQNSHWIGAVAVRRTSSSYTWNTPTISSVASDVGTANTAHSATTGSSFTTHSGAFLIIGTVLNDLATSGVAAISQTGGTFGTVTERADGGTATGNDVAGQINTCTVSGGATATITITQTLSAASQGGNLIVEQRETGLKTATLTDDFTTKDTGKWNWLGTSGVSGGRLSIPADASFNNWIQNNAYYDLSGSSYSARIVQLPTAGSGAQVVLRLRGDLGGAYRLETYWDRATGTLHFSEWGVSAEDTTSITYDAVAHQYWRIRESGGTVFWDTSPDGANWTNRRSKTPALDVTYLRPDILAGGTGVTGNTLIDDLNCNPLTSSFTDNFNTGISPTWVKTGTVTNPSGRLRIDHTSALSNYSYAETPTAYDLTGSSVSMQVYDFGNMANTAHNIEFVCGPDNANNVMIEANNGILFAQKTVANSSVGVGSNLTLDTTAHKWWRIRESAGTIYYDTAPDGVTWTNRWSVATPSWDATEVKTSIFVGNHSAGTGGASYAILDNFNTLPPTSELIDTFISLDTTTKWYAIGSEPPSVSSGALSISCLADYPALSSQGEYNLIGSSFSAQLVQPPNVGNGTAQTFLQVANSPSGGTEGYAYVWSNNQFQPQKRISNVPSAIGSLVNYDPAVHKFFRIRESAGTTYWDYSTDGASWTNHYSQASLVDLTIVNLQIWSGYYGTEPNPGTAIWDNVNNTLPKLETLIDTFATKDTSKWYWNSTATVTSGQMVLTPKVDWSDYIDTGSARFSLLGSSLAVKLAQPPNVGNGGTDTYLNVVTSQGNGVVGIDWNNNNLVFVYKDNNVPDNTTVTYNSTNHKWLRIREYNGTIYWDTSDDGSWWTNRRTRVAGFPLNNVYVRFGAGYDGTEPSPGTAIWDTVNAKTEYLTDRFDTKDTTEWTFQSGATVTNGQAALTVSGGTATSIDAKVPYDLTGSSIVVQVPSIVAGGEAWLDYISNPAGSNSYMAIYRDPDGTSLVFRESVAGVQNQTFITYDPVAHRWWRLRENGGTIYWDTSPDGVTWTNRRNKVAGQTYTSWYPQLYAGTANGTYLFDNFNLVPMANFSDTFATQDATKWDYAAAASVSGGQLLLPANASATGSVSGYRPGWFDLTGSSATIQIVQYPTAAGGNTLDFAVNSGLTSTYFDFQWWATDQKVYCGEIVSGVSSWDGGTVTTDKWWRIRESDGVIYWDTSANGLSWTNRRSKVPEIQTITRMYPDIWTTGSGGGTGIVESFNIAAVQSNTQGLLRMF